MDSSFARQGPAHEVMRIAAAQLVEEAEEREHEADRDLAEEQREKAPCTT